MSIDLSLARIEPYKHQIVGVEELVKWDDPLRGRIYPGCFFLGDEMGAGKTKQTIDAAQTLFAEREIDRVIVVAPASVRSVWYDEELGELAKHLWESMPALVAEFHARQRSWTWGPSSNGRMEWIISNYEFIGRSKARLHQLLSFATSKTLLICDESSLVKNHKALQTIATLQLRRKCRRVWELNGTPIANSPGDMFSQGQIMDPRILGCKTYFHFKSRYAILGGFENRQIVGWVNLADLQRRFAPYILRRLKTDCLDLPPKLPPVIIQNPLTEDNWRRYKSMRDEMVVWLNDSAVSMAPQSIVKVMRLAQLTSGFLGGLQNPGLEDDDFVGEDRPDWMPLFEEPKETATHTEPVQEVGREKLDAFFEFLERQLAEDPALKLLVWHRFRPELDRTVREVAAKYPSMAVGEFRGQQKKDEREYAKRLMDPRTAPKGPAMVSGILKTGSMGQNFTASHTMIEMSYDYNLKDYLQGQDRVHRPGQTMPVSYYFIVATGPAGQKTIDHTLVKARQTKENLANWTTSAWVRALTEE